MWYTTILFYRWVVDKKIETVFEVVYEQQCKEVTVPECDIVTIVITEAGMYVFKY